MQNQRKRVRAPRDLNEKLTFASNTKNFTWELAAPKKGRSIAVIKQGVRAGRGKM